MTQNQAAAFGTPNYHRDAQNVGGTEIPKGRIVKQSGAYPGAALATSVADNLWGISTEVMAVDGVSRSIQVEGPAAVETGASFARDALLTTDSTGRAIEATDDDKVIGRAVQASTGAGDWVGVELGHRNAAAGNIRIHEVTITHAELTAAALSEVLDLGAELPTGARIVAAEAELTTLFSGGSVSAITVDVGDEGGDTDAIFDGLNLFTGAGTGFKPTSGVRPTGTYSEKQLIGTFVSVTANVVALTAGEVTFRFFYVIAD